MGFISVAIPLVLCVCYGAQQHWQHQQRPIIYGGMCAETCKKVVEKRKKIKQQFSVASQPASPNNVSWTFCFSSAITQLTLPSMSRCRWLKVPASRFSTSWNGVMKMMARAPTSMPSWPLGNDEEGRKEEMDAIWNPAIIWNFLIEFPYFYKILNAILK